jgi:hypothetical protein
VSQLAYIRNLTSQIYKMLPMSDSDELIERMHLKEFINSIIVQIDGSLLTFPNLSSDEDYIIIMNILHYWDSNDIKLIPFKREVRKMMRCLNRIELRCSANE